MIRCGKVGDDLDGGGDLRELLFHPAEPDAPRHGGVGERERAQRTESPLSCSTAPGPHAIAGPVKNAVIGVRQRTSGPSRQRRHAPVSEKATCSTDHPSRMERRQLGEQMAVELVQVERLDPPADTAHDVRVRVFR